MDDVVLTEGTLHDNIRYKYQGNEFTKELGLHWMDFHARQYDPQLGRFLGIDPLADARMDSMYIARIVLWVMLRHKI